MKINKADVAELVDARDLKSPAPVLIACLSCKTSKLRPAVQAANPRLLQNNLWEILSMPAPNIALPRERLEIAKKINLTRGELAERGVVV